MERDSGWSHNGHKEIKMEKLQEIRKSLLEQNDLSTALTSSCKYVLSYYSLKNKVGIISLFALKICNFYSGFFLALYVDVHALSIGRFYFISIF